MIEITLRSLLAAGLALLFVGPLGAAIGYLLARRRVPFKPAIDTLVSLPLVLPPVAVGILLLWLLAPRSSWLGRALAEAGVPFFLSFRGVVLCAAVMGMPLMVRAAEAAFAATPREAEETALNLGASCVRTLAFITLPLASRGLVYGGLLAFARGLGEFGATIVLAGYRPGHTDTLALSIYFAAEDPARSGDLLGLMAIAIGLCFFVTLAARLALGDLRRQPAPGPRRRV